ncbi:MAG: histidine phosphatase family protein [Sedimenticola sp.]
MRPKRIILVRHGESIGNIDKNLYAHTPDHAVSLTDKGREQARLAGQNIRHLIRDESVYAYSSPWVRAAQTFEGIREEISQNIVRSIEDPRIREQDWGHYKEKAFLVKENEARKEYGKFYFRLQDGESGADVYDRVSTFLETLHRDFNKPDYPDNALIVTHGVTLLVFLMRWFHWTVQQFDSYRNPKNCQVVVLERQNGGRYNIVSPLERYSEEGGSVRR